jgi:5-formyltetrahydrofolate cyclo-ligase
MEKKELRKIIRKRKNEHTDEELKALSEPIMERLICHPKLKQSQTILMYYSLPDEVNTHVYIDKLISMGKNVLLPKVVDDENMIICHYRSEADLCEGAYHIMEPIGKEFADYDKIELCVVPGMSFDLQNNRLGRGKGYYDRFLAKVPDAYKIGVCFDFQKMDIIPADRHDMKVDEVI